MLNDRENILSALREKPLKVYEIMKRANVVNEEACQSLLLKMRDETEQPDHSASLGDSITSSTRIRFSVHTAYSVAGRMYQSGLSEEIYPDLVAGTRNHRYRHSLVAGI